MSDVRCVAGVDLLADYLEGLLSPAVRTSIERHVLSCERCQSFVASYQAAPAILRRATDVVLPDELRARLSEWMKMVQSASPTPPEAG
jgi:anti-sigma factor RsiW